MPADEPSSDGNRPQSNDAGQSSRRKARALVWLVAGCCVLVGGLNLGLYIFECQRKHLTVSWVHSLWLAIPLVMGVWLLVKSAALADWINDWLDQ